MNGYDIPDKETKYYKIFNPSVGRVTKSKEPLDTEVYDCELAEVELSEFKHLAEVDKVIVNSWLKIMEERLHSLIFEKSLIETKNRFLKFFYRKRLKILNEKIEMYKKLAVHDYVKLLNSTILESFEECIKRAAVKAGIDGITLIKPKDNENKILVKIESWNYEVPVWAHYNSIDEGED